MKPVVMQCLCNVHAMNDAVNRAVVAFYQKRGKKGGFT